jgi:FixJ family two-component response regulator
LSSVNTMPKMLPGGRRRTPERAQTAPKRVTPSAQRRASLANANRATVLVVDDDPSILPALARLIRSAGFLVITFDRPSALLAYETPTTNACVLVDIHLPEMNGFELCEKLVESGRGLPAIMITGRNTPETQRMIEQAHPVAALFKPIDEQTLFDAIARALALSNTESN